MNKINYFRHGDVHVIPVAEIPSGFEPIAEKVLEYGELTGHSHHFEGDTAQVFQSKSGPQRYLRVVEPTDLKHEEHHTRTIPPGIYEVRRTRETDHMTRVTRQVAD
jgi:hypothetical protein